MFGLNLSSVTSTPHATRQASKLVNTDRQLPWGKCYTLRMKLVNGELCVSFGGLLKIQEEERGRQ